MLHQNLSSRAGAGAWRLLHQLGLLSFVFLLGLPFSGAAEAAVSVEGRRWNIAASVPLPCACWQGGIGYELTDYAAVGVNGYHGAGFVISSTETKQVGAYVQLRPYAGSLYLQLAAGHMSTSDESEFFDIREKDSGPYWGAALGSTWRLGRRWTHGIVWYGQDFYFKPSEVEPLAHFLRYQFGFTF